MELVHYEVFDSQVNAAVIHPKSLFENERELAKAFAERYKVDSRIEDCPICGCARDEVIFEKWGQKYAICPNTWSLSLASMPEEKVWKEYFYTSELAQFRASAYFQEEVARKRAEFWRSHAEWIDGRVKRYLGSGLYDVIDWGTKAVSWYEELKEASFAKSVYVKDPLPPVEEMTARDSVDIVCLMDVIQRQCKPRKLLEQVQKALKPDGILIAACRAGSGFDILSLREHSDSVYPFDHIFLPSPQEMKLLLEGAGFEILEITTPGLLDVDFLRKGSADIPKDQYFQRYILSQPDELVFERLQAFLQRNNLSSHLRVVARKVVNEK